MLISFGGATGKGAALELENFSGGTLKELGWEGGHLDEGKADFQLVTEGKETFLRSKYLVGTEAKCLKKAISWDVARYPMLRWRWRVHKFPRGAKVLEPKVSDAAAQVYVLWRDFPIYYVIKYFWSTADAADAVLEQGSVFFGRLWGRVLRTGGETGQWRPESRNLLEDFRNAFHRAPPGLVRGLALLSDGDETGSESEADYDDFVAYSEEGS